jgi:uncharacterized membrane protein
MAVRTSGTDHVAPRRGPGTARNVLSALAVAAGYGLAVSAFLVITIERMFGPRGAGGRLAVLAMTVTVLVAGAAIVRARRSWQRRRLRGG